MPYSAVSFHVTSSDLAKYSKTRSITQSLYDSWACFISVCFWFSFWNNSDSVWNEFGLVWFEKTQFGSYSIVINYMCSSWLVNLHQISQSYCYVYTVFNKLQQSHCMSSFFICTLNVGKVIFVTFNLNCKCTQFLWGKCRNRCQNFGQFGLFRNRIQTNLWFSAHP